MPRVRLQIIAVCSGGKVSRILPERVRQRLALGDCGTDLLQQFLEVRHRRGLHQGIESPQQRHPSEPSRSANWL